VGFWFFASLTLLVASLISAILWLNQPKAASRTPRASRPSEYRESRIYDPVDWRLVLRRVTHITLALGLIAMLFSTLAIVGTKTVGVVTVFGKPSGQPLSSGLHFKAPWAQVHMFDATVQVDKYEGDTCVNVRMAGQTTGCVTAVVSWRIIPSEANRLKQDYKDFDRVHDTLVGNNVTATLSQVFAAYDPLSQVVDGSEVAATPEVSGYAVEVKKQLQDAVGNGVEIVSVTTPFIKYDDTTQNRLNELQAEVANTRVAEQKKLTATAEAEANAQLSASVSNDPNVLVSKCLDLLSGVVQSGQPLPDGFSCWPGGTSTAIAVGGNTTSDK